MCTIISRSERTRKARWRLPTRSDRVPAPLRQSAFAPKGLKRGEFVCTLWETIMRQPLIAGNWKMNLNRSESVGLAEQIAGHVASEGPVEVLICPPFVYLDPVYQTICDSPVRLGAQNVYPQPNGAFTGEISTSMLVDLHCQYVILGHSERRHILGETDQVVCQKVHAALAAGVTPILCVGELLEEREAGRTTEVVRGQIEGSLAGLTADQVAQTVVAYEPVWAIGTGKTASPEQAQEVHADLRKMLAERYNADAADSIRILYGGSVKPANATQLLAQSEIDGALVGGASLDATSFLEIIAAAAP